MFIFSRQPHWLLIFSTYSRIGLRTSFFLAATACVGLLFIAPMAGCTGSAVSTSQIPITLEQAPEEADALTLWNEFKADENAAKVKYQDKTLHFSRVSVDKMSFLGEGADQELYVQEGINPTVEQVKFRTDLMSDIISVREGYIVEIVGKVQGMQFGYLNVRISWLKVIDPPGGDTNPPAEY